MQYGPICPQQVNTFVDISAFFWEHMHGRMDEDCLRMNIWTPGINDNRKRPVLLWLHEGGFYRGSSYELKALDGNNLARRGDVVVVSINHRLNAFGFLNMAEFGEKYASSVNVGMLDIVAALEWVRDNIAAFGGDPGSVTVFGQSGGGAKVNHLMAMPAAKGLFHKAVAQSPHPLITESYSIEQAARFTAAVLKEMGLDRSRIEQMHTVSHETLVRATSILMRRDRERQFDLRPVADGTIIPVLPFHSAAPEISAGVPLLIGNTARESGPILGPIGERMTEAEMLQNVVRKYGDRAEQILAVFRRTYPGGKPVDLWSHINLFEERRTAILQATRKAAQKAAPAYVYLFAWKTSVFEGMPRAFHGSEVAFIFDNTDRCARMTGGTAEAREMAAKTSDAWIQFARTGDPSHHKLPKWPAFTSEREPTMIFDNKCEMKFNYDREARLIIA
jgi:para-nitrobenzyl esterase